MNRYFRYFIGIVAALVLSVGVVIAATLQVSSIGGVSTGTGTLTSFTTTKTSPTMIGTAAVDATVDITIDDLTVAVTADSLGDWSYTPTSLAEGDHAVAISSNLETLSFTLTVDSGTSSSSTSTESSTTTKGGTSTTSGELPQAGAVENTVLVIAAGMFLMGLGVTAHQKLPVPKEE